MVDGEPPSSTLLKPTLSSHFPLRLASTRISAHQGSPLDLPSRRDIERIAASSYLIDLPACRETRRPTRPAGRVRAIGSLGSVCRTGDRSSMSAVRQALSQASSELLHRGFRPSGSDLRLPGRLPDAHPGRDCRPAQDDVALPRAAAHRRRAHRRSACGWHTLDPRRSPGPGAGRGRALPQERRRQSPHALVQGPRGGRGPVESGRARLPDRGLRLDR